MPADVRLVTAAGPRIGRGHLGRALSLAEGHWPDGVRLELEIDPAVLGRIEADRAEAAEVAIVPPGTSVAPGTVVVIDRPDPGAAAAAYPSSPRVVFDDTDAFTDDAEIVVQPSRERWAGSGHAGRVLAGYSWVPIGARWRRPVPTVEHEGVTPDMHRRRLLVCFGGSDPGGVTARLGPIVGADPRWSTTIVLGHGYSGERPAGVDMRTDPGDLPELVAAADLALVSAGTIKFEVAALGRPALLVGGADDQRAVGPAFAETGAARWIGDGRTVDPERVREAVATCLADHRARAAMSAAARSVIDGRGADRLATEIATLLDRGAN